MTITVAICTHNPVPAILQRCLAGLRQQAAMPPQAELLVIDNASDRPLPFKTDEFPAGHFASIRVVREEKLGLAHARHRALQEAQGEIVVFVDDDNILAPDFLSKTAAFFSVRPQAGAVGGRCHGVFDVTPPEWFAAVSAYLAIVDQGDKPFHLKEPGWWAPVGAGLAVRKEPALQAFAKPMLLTDRKGKSLASGGDTEICYRISLLGYELWYFPDLELGHFIPAGRWEMPYLMRLADGIGQSQAYLELYRLPAHLRKPLFLFRRAIFFLRNGFMMKRRAGRTMELKEKIALQMESQRLHRQALTMLGLCFNVPEI